MRLSFYVATSLTLFFFATSSAHAERYVLFDSDTTVAAAASDAAEEISNRELVAIVVAFGVLIGVALGKVLYDSVRKGKEIREANKRLTQLLEEQDIGAKMLVRRDLELSEANERLQTLDQTKSNFVTVAAHQLRTPLSAVKWGLRLLGQGDFGGLNNDQKRMLDKIYESNERMIALVNDMLNVDRIESGKFTYHFVPVRLTGIVDDALFELSPQAQKRNITVVFEERGERFPFINADPERIRSALLNLIENAIHYTMDGGTVTITVTRDDTMITVAITDTGIGIPKDEEKNIFRRFFRGSNAIKAEANGTGLGLFIARSIIENHRGRLWFERNGDKGTIFSFSLPIYQGDVKEL